MNPEPFYPITALHKDDLRQLFRDSETGHIPAAINRQIESLTDADMQHIASKMADAFCNCCYWEALKAIFTSYSLAAEAGGAGGAA